MAGVQMGRADLEPVAVGWERSRRRCVCPRRYGQTHSGRDRTDEDARKWGRAFHDEWCSCYLTSWYSACCYSAIELLLSYLLLKYRYPGPTVVTRKFGGTHFLATGNRRNPVPPRLQCLGVRSYTNPGSRKGFGRDQGEGSFRLRATTTFVVPLAGSSSGNQAWPAVHRKIRSCSRTMPDSVRKFIWELPWCQSHKRCRFILHRFSCSF
jgi:hypothetical protein